MWHLMQKRSLRFAIFKWIAVCMQLISCSNRLGIHSNGSSYLLKKKWSAVQTAPAVHAKKKLSSVWVAWAICSKKIVSCLNGSSCLCKKNCFLLEQLRLSIEKNCQPFEQLGLFVRKKLATVQKLDPAICLKKNFAGFPFQNNFLTSYLCQMICYSPCILEWFRYELCLQTYHE